MATAEQKKTITKKRLQELRNQCRDHYNVVADGVLPDGADAVSYTHLTLPTT